MNEVCTVKSILEASRTCLMAEANLATRQECLELHILHSCFSHSTHLHTYAQRGQQRVFRQVCLLLRSSNFKFFFFKWAVEGCCFSDKNFISSIFLRIRITIFFSQGHLFWDKQCNLFEVRRRRCTGFYTRLLFVNFEWNLRVIRRWMESDIILRSTLIGSFVSDWQTTILVI